MGIGCHGNSLAQESKQQSFINNSNQMDIENKNGTSHVVTKAMHMPLHLIAALYPWPTPAA
jgi:hypothetical protein